jgi:hypothetical protein
MEDVVIGAWRNGLSPKMTADIAHIEDRYNKGFRQLPWESTVMELVLILDAQDLMFDDLLADMAHDCDCDHDYPLAETLDDVEIPIEVPKPKTVRKKK